jgi:diaminopimelate epimerase
MRFEKMQGTGNDFIIINNMELRLPEEKLPAIAARVCARRVSLGGDALMVAEAPAAGGDLKMRFYNADGSEGEMCGNGARCLARYACENGLAGEEARIETMSGDVYGWRLTERLYKIRLNRPSVMDLDRPAEYGGVTYRCAYVELGDPGLPHAVVRLPGLAGKSREELRGIGAALRGHAVFPKGANVNFYDLAEDGAVRLLTYERGVEDFTLACGTGAGCTAAVLAAQGTVRGRSVALDVPGGRLRVELEYGGGRVTELYLLGDTNRVAAGELTDEDLVI